MPKAPASFAKQVRRVLYILFPLTLVVGLVLASFQKRFSADVFEFGRSTEIKGVYFNSPVPLLKVVSGKDGWGNTSYITIPLVGYGKHGAETAIRELEKEKNLSFNNREIIVKGSLLYGDGKTLLQVSKEEDPVVRVGEDTVASSLSQPVYLGTRSLKGEIIDPKCYFGVMKPGEGHVHRDCAIRCILGGIPPVLKVMNEKGKMEYYLLVGPNGEKMNETVQDLVAEPVAIEARAVQLGDWVILYVKDKSIKRVSAISLYRPGNEIASCTASCMK